MMKLYVAICLNTGLVLFVLGWIAGRNGAGMRRTGIWLAVAAFAPAVIIGLVHAGGITVLQTLQDHPLACILIFAAISVAAHGVLQLRKASAPKTSRPKPKRPYTHTGKPDVISMIKEELGRDA